MTAFGDLRDYVALPRVTALRLAPDGSWLAAVVQAPGGDGKKYATSIWRVGTAPDARPERLTRSAEGEAGPAFLPDGSLAFASKRPGPPAGVPSAGPDEDGTGKGKKDGSGAGSQDEAGAGKPALWLLPARGGEARRIAAPPGGVAAVAAARRAQVAVFTAPVLPGTADAGADARRRKAREDAGVTAILHESGPVRHWDHDLGPDALRLLASEIGPEPGMPGAAGGEQAGGAAGTAAGDRQAEGGGQPRDLTPDAGRALDEHSFELSPDGSVAVTGWSFWGGEGERRDEVVAIDAATGARRTLLGAVGFDFDSPRISPDGRLVACSRQEHDSYIAPGDVTLVVTALDGSGAPRDLLAGWDRRPAEAAWAADSSAVYVTADDRGRRPVFKVDLATAEIIRLTADDAAYENLCPAPDGRYLYALRSAVDAPPAPVRIDVFAPGTAPVRLASPGATPRLPGRLTEVQTAAADGTPVRGWLVLPDGASASAPAPLLLWVHGGPLSSWNAWSWRWNPWLMAARGYAVLLPDPALSTGYGHAFIARGYGQWGGSPFTDAMAITDAVVARPDIDADRTAMMGGSFGGYMANWIAGQTGRFRAIVSHAGLWALDQVFGTTDLPSYWRRMFGDPIAQPGRYLENSPNQQVGKITTPVLVIHGDKDYRVPVGEALRMWWDLQGRGKEARFLYFPDENHWILAPGHVRVWYETVLAFLAQYVLGEPWRRPDLL